jgi:hypothetical protein
MICQCGCGEFVTGLVRIRSGVSRPRRYASRACWLRSCELRTQASRMSKGTHYKLRREKFWQELSRLTPRITREELTVLFEQAYKRGYSAGYSTAVNHQRAKRQAAA